MYRVLIRELALFFTSSSIKLAFASAYSSSDVFITSATVLACEFYHLTIYFMGKNHGSTNFDVNMGVNIEWVRNLL